MGMAARVLVVDDDTALRTMLVTIVEAMGCHARGATDGADALEILGCWCPDVILLDLLMPVMNGARFLRQRASVPDFPNIPVIVITSATLRDVPSAEQLGVYAVVSKPHDMGVLRALIEQSTRDIVTGAG